MLRILPLTVVLVALLGLSMARPLGAQETTEAKVAVLDVERILRESTAAAEIRSQIDTFRQSFQSELTGEEEQLRAEEQELRRQRAILAPEAFDEKRKGFERRVTEVQRSVQQKRRALDRSFRVAMNEVREEIIAIVAELSQERKFNIVMDKSQLVYFATPLEITNTVMEQLNKRLPTVKVPPPELSDG